MLVYTVTKPVGTKNREFEAYTRLLEDVGIDVSNSPRVPEPGTDRRWLYAWKNQLQAERFADELRRRTGDAGWKVYQFEEDREERGPVAPLDIARIPDQGGYTYYLSPASRERVAVAFPGKLPARLNLRVEIENDFLSEKGDAAWMEIAHLLTGRTDDEIDALGGVRVIIGDGEVAFERIPTAA